MADRPNSIPLAWEELEPLRSVFLRHIPDSTTREALRRAGVFLFAATLETATTTPPEPSEVAADLQALALDLRWCAGFLRNVVAASVEAFELSPQDETLAALAGRWAVELDAVVSRIDEALA